MHVRMRSDVDEIDAGTSHGEVPARRTPQRSDSKRINALSVQQWRCCRSSSISQEGAGARLSPPDVDKF